MMKFSIFLASLLFSVVSSALTTYDCVLDSKDKIQLDLQDPTTIVINNIIHPYTGDNPDGSRRYYFEQSSPEGRVSWELIVPSTLGLTTPPQQFDMKYVLTSDFAIFGSPMWSNYTGSCVVR